MKCHASVEHFGRTPYQCDLCDYNTSLKHAIRNHIENRHLKKHPPRVKRSTTCTICGYFCVSKDAYNSHVKVHRGSDDRPFNCTHCNLFFRTEVTLKTHNRKKHMHDDRPFLCKLCINACFVSEEILQKHMERHTIGESKKSTQQQHHCNACELRFGNIKHYENHVKYHERNELTNCQVCGLTLHYTSVREHMTKHEMKQEDYPFVCEICAKRFRLNDTLRQHVKVHNNPEYFECDKCHIRIKKKPSFSVSIKLIF